MSVISFTPHIWAVGLDWTLIWANTDHGQVNYRFSTSFSIISINYQQYLIWIPVVTGSTDGIGKEYAKQVTNININTSQFRRRAQNQNWNHLSYSICQLAAKGLNIVLISRSPAKLQDTKTEIGRFIKQLFIVYKWLSLLNEKYPWTIISCLVEQKKTIFLSSLNLKSTLNVSFLQKNCSHPSKSRQSPSTLPKTRPSTDKWRPN